MTKFDTESAMNMIKICDDIIRAESKSNTTDTELKETAYTGIKKILSGALTGVESNFTFESSSIKAVAVRF